MAQTPTHGWPTPDDVDRVSQGAAAMRALGDAIDGSMPKIATGVASVTVTDNANVYDVAVTFPPGRFTSTPRISLAWTTNRVIVAMSGVTVNGMTLSARMVSGVSSTSCTIHWTAIQTGAAARDAADEPLEAGTLEAGQLEVDAGTLEAGPST